MRPARMALEAPSGARSMQFATLTSHVGAAHPHAIEYKRWARIIIHCNIFCVYTVRKIHRNLYKIRAANGTRIQKLIIPSFDGFWIFVQFAARFCCVGKVCNTVKINSVRKRKLSGRWTGISRLKICSFFLENSYASKYIVIQKTIRPIIQWIQIKSTYDKDSNPFALAL